MRHGKERMVLFMDSLIKLLKGNARLSNEQLAVMLGVTPEEPSLRPEPPRRSRHVLPIMKKEAL